MKTMKYRSIFATFTAVALSVFLFTSCEKESDNTSGASDFGDRFEKYKRLQFSTGSATSSTNNGSGTFIGNGGSIAYVPPGGGAAQFAPTVNNEKGFTDITSTGREFAVANPFGFGGGSITIDGEQENLALAFCADYDFTLDDQDTSSMDSERDLNIFIGIGGDFDVEDLSGQDFTPEFLVYAYSYNGGSELGSIDDFRYIDSEEDFTGAFLIFAMFGKDDNGNPTTASYFATSGSVVFAGTEVFLSDVQLGDITKFNSEGVYEGETVPMSGNLECASYEDFAGE